jgi:hypothetical protein
LEWHHQTPFAGKNDWVFASNKLRGKRPISGCQFVKGYIRPRFVEHGLIDADYTGRAGLHAFRHSLATVLIVEEKVDPNSSSILRHTDAGLTMNIYTHAQDPAKRAALERFESRWVQLTQVKTGNTGKESQVRASGIEMAMEVKPLRMMVDLVGFEPTTSSMPWKWKTSKLLRAKAEKVGCAGQNRKNSQVLTPNLTPRI